MLLSGAIDIRVFLSLWKIEKSHECIPYFHLSKSVVFLLALGVKFPRYGTTMTN
jgi:hypothetical protein